MKKIYFKYKNMGVNNLSNEEIACVEEIKNTPEKGRFFDVQKCKITSGVKAALLSLGISISANGMVQAGEVNNNSNYQEFGITQSLDTTKLDSDLRKGVVQLQGIISELEKNGELDFPVFIEVVKNGENLQENEDIIFNKLSLAPTQTLENLGIDISKLIENGKPNSENYRELVRALTKYDDKEGLKKEASKFVRSGYEGSELSDYELNSYVEDIAGSGYRWAAKLDGFASNEDKNFYEEYKSSYSKYKELLSEVKLLKSRASEKGYTQAKEDKELVREFKSLQSYLKGGKEKYKEISDLIERSFEYAISKGFMTEEAFLEGIKLFIEGVKKLSVRPTREAYRRLLIDALSFAYRNGGYEKNGFPSTDDTKKLLLTNIGEYTLLTQKGVEMLRVGFGKVDNKVLVEYNYPSIESLSNAGYLSKFDYAQKIVKESFDIITSKESILAELKIAKNNLETAKNKEQTAKNKEQTAKNKEQTAKNKEYASLVDKIEKNIYLIEELIGKYEKTKDKELIVKINNLLKIIESDNSKASSLDEGDNSDLDKNFKIYISALKAKISNLS